MLNFARIACAVPAVRVANPQENARQICKWMEKADKENCDILVFPELSLTGYTCADLFFQESLLHGALEGLSAVTACSAQHPHMMTVVGLPLRLDGLLYNCAAVIAGGEVKGLVPKTYIPDYGEFNEKRWFASATNLRRGMIEVRALGIDAWYAVPVGADRTFSVGEGTVLGVEICEDLWAPASGSSRLALSGAQIIVNLAASNEAAGKRTQRQTLVKTQSGANRSVYVFCSAGAEESTQDLLFSGHSIVAQCGELLAENQVLAASDYMLVTDVDLGIVNSQRCRDTSFRDAAAAIQAESAGISGEGLGKQLRSDGSLYRYEKNPFLPSTATGRCREVFHIQVEGLKRRLETVGAKAVVGISGGLDSTLALLVAVEANRRLGRPASDVHGITMPCFGTSDRTYNNALTLMDLLGVTARQIDIRDAVMQHFKGIGQDPKVHNATYENAQARERTQVLMDYAGMVGGIVVGTGDLSELALGWCTYNADHMSMYSVNASVPKTMMPHIINEAAQMPIFQSAQTVLQDIIATPISPELLPPDSSGEISQQTEDLVGPYVLHDFFLYHVLRYGFAPEKLYTIACRTFREDFGPETVKKWLKAFYRRFFSQQFKRSCMPEGVKAGELSLSPRGDWRMPSDASAALWLKELENL